ncbi:hypothetical protein Achl_4331 (plasmid) [Pseudarthrobacter chlorophenolicus A6]|uniref:Uncharacterized protein n=1 Tax=Pseudarthrobacter chlorophenolicus (strain ATCC 700700 / DSM 12829 / CIP 107037 / JCM 12360 / KCTC 9906 / NCIMB 13794 / A6) TaxID=452863 RepID=B8HIN5_PSECP|nr:hypothetical protein [Pseudarthrobacter chlorophenolicus]ACL42282.1 hypothetical protein Achl_4331 [Pseudarthrobacter chlorophenolicus A6]SDQ15933.1 hypothetical protein SAMN04489738_0389 [Pseudarthrobacter chlorophenolicus]
MTASPAATEAPAYKPFDVVIYDREDRTGLYFLPGTLAEKPAGNWGHICVGRPRLRTLTDEELAAMYWHARYLRMKGQGKHVDTEGKLVDEATVLERFYRRPAVS